MDTCIKTCLISISQNNLGILPNCINLHTQTHAHTPNANDYEQYNSNCKIFIPKYNYSLEYTQHLSTINVSKKKTDVQI